MNLKYRWENQVDFSLEMTLNINKYLKVALLRLKIDFLQGRE